MRKSTPRKPLKPEALTPAPMPRHVTPMLACLSPLPRDEAQFAFEYKWDGVRAIAFCDSKGLRLETRNLLDSTHRYPELWKLAAALKGRTAILDGEIVALDERGRPSFSLLQRRMHVSEIRGLQGSVPIVYMLFDVLYLDGRPTMHLKYEQRREILEGLKLSHGPWQTPPFYVGQGHSMLEAARGAGLEGVVAKRLGSIYTPGLRSRDWLKVKIVQRQEFVVGGWTPGEGANRGGIGSLLLGYYTEEEGGHRELHYAGSVGTGFNGEDHRRIMPMLNDRRRKANPFAERPPKPGAMFIEPELVAEVEYREWTHDGILRHPSFKGLRADKRPEEVVREEPLSGKRANVRKC